MTLVVDASVAVKWFVAEELHEEAERLLDLGDTLTAPDLIVPEVTNIVWKKTVLGQIDPSHAAIVAAAICNSPVILHPSSRLNERALEIALDLNHPVYDCLYIACAEAAGGTLITADRRLFSAAQSSAYRELVRHLADPGS